MLSDIELEYEFNEGPDGEDEVMVSVHCRDFPNNVPLMFVTINRNADRTWGEPYITTLEELKISVIQSKPKCLETK